MQRTIRIRLQPSPSQAGALAETSRQFTSAFNQAVRLGWQEGICNATKLHIAAQQKGFDMLSSHRPPSRAPLTTLLALLVLLAGTLGLPTAHTYAATISTII